MVTLHDSSSRVLYKALNIYAKEERYIYFISDLPHLIKTVRNCWHSKHVISGYDIIVYNRGILFSILD